MTDQRKQRREQKRQAILEAASIVFGEVGVHSATLEQIGEKVGLSKASLYYYFDGKEVIVAEVLNNVLTEIDTRAAELGSSDSTLVEQLRFHAEATIATAVGTPAGRLIVSNLDYLSEIKSTAALLRKHEQRVRDIISSAQKEGLMREVDVASATKLFYGGLNNIPKWQRGGKESLKASLDVLMDILMNGLVAK